MSGAGRSAEFRRRVLWFAAFGLLAAYVATRMGAFVWRANVATADGMVTIPTTFASVDHPFHVARADTLWRELASGQILRWVGQHQGGYPVEFYPLGEAWLEVLIRAASLGALPAEGAHTLAVVALFLLPGIAFVALARDDGFPPAVALLALALHVSLPGGWYAGGYTELVQWGLVTNVAGAVAAFLMLPALTRFLDSGDRRAAALAAALAAAAIYCNPRSMVGLAALAAGAWVAAVWCGRRNDVALPTARVTSVALMAGLLAAPQLVSTVRFRDLYSFVHYSGYDTLSQFAVTTVEAATWPVVILAGVGVAFALLTRAHLRLRAAAFALLIYVGLTLLFAFVPAISGVAAQLEPTRLMPLQRLLTIYLAAAMLWVAPTALTSKWPAPGARTRSLALAGLAVAVLAVQTRPLPGPPPDPASPAVPAVSLYPVVTSGRAEQVELEAAVRAADEAAAPGTALLVLGSALSWHQQLWAPLWTTRPLFYDNWLWYWHSDHAGTPGYRAASGHHYPDPERALDRDYLAAHGIGAVVVTGAAQSAAAGAGNLEQIREGLYDAYRVVAPVTTVTFGEWDAEWTSFGNQQIAASSESSGAPVLARANWYPRWNATSGSAALEVRRESNGYLGASSREPLGAVELIYQVQPLDWLARVLAAAGVAWLVFLALSRREGPPNARWYSQRQRGNVAQDHASEVRMDQSPE